MRKFTKYLSILPFIMIFLSCQKQTLYPDNKLSDVISFSARVETKAPIITEMNGREFGVYGFNFSSLTNWNTVMAKASPNVFYNTEVQCRETDGACIYGVGENNELVPWDLDKKYSFFAYHPYQDGTTGSVKPSPVNITENGNETPVYGIPYIDYTLPLTTSVENPEVDPDDLLDIMTAKVTDYRATQGTTVRFAFNHRLFCLDIYGHNFNADPVVISDLRVKISGIKYDKTRIYLDQARTIVDDNENIIPAASEPSTTDNWSTEDAKTFRILQSNETVSVPIRSNDPTSLTGTKNIVLIPQDSRNDTQGLSIEINFKKDGKDYYAVDTDENPIPLKGTYKIDFKEGKKYSLKLNFIGDDVILVAGDAVEWKEKEVEHTFE